MYIWINYANIHFHYSNTSCLCLMNTSDMAVFFLISNKLKYEKYKVYDIDDADYDEVVLFLYKERI